MNKARPYLEVHLDAPEIHPGPLLIGRLYPHEVKSDLAPAFSYDPAWLRHPGFFALDPRLDSYVGEQYAPTARGFGIFLDSAPDRWGRVLLERREAWRASKEGRVSRRLSDLDFLLGVHDSARTGALRFRWGENGAFLDDDAALAAPPITSLPELSAIAQRIEEPDADTLPEYERWLGMLVAPGTSLGGARPKATFREPNGRLWLAKFPAKNDRHDWGAWEYLTHRLAQAAGIEVPPARLLDLGERHRCFCVQRFDRGGPVPPGSRRMYASAMTLLERQDGEAGGSYLDLVQMLEDRGGKGLGQDLQQLFRRALFNLIMANRDDHLRNHGCLLQRDGWRLSPAFDMNPNRDRAGHALSWDGRHAEPDIERLGATHDHYRLTLRQALAIKDEVVAAAATWRQEAAKLAIPAVEIELMAAVIQVD